AGAFGAAPAGGFGSAACGTGAYGANADVPSFGAGVALSSGLPQVCSGSVPVRNTSTLPVEQSRTRSTSPAGIGKSCFGVFASAAFMKRAQIRAGMFPPYDSLIFE